VPFSKSDGLQRRELKRAFAKTLRANPTDAQNLLWLRLRRKNLGTLRFCRQQPIGPYIVDFFCSSAKLVIELDGDQHGRKDVIAYDDVRAGFLRERGYRVLRFSNRDVLKNTE